MRGSSLVVAACALLATEVLAAAPVEIVPLGGVPEALATSGVYEISGDGSMAVGWARRTANGPQVAQAWRLLPTPHRIDLGDLPGGIESSSAQSVSADGRVIAGPGTTELGQQAWRWTEETGMVPLAHLPGDTSSYVNAVSADGGYACGYSAGPGRREAVVWGPDGTPRGLGDLPGGGFNSYAGDCTAYARVVVGSAQTQAGLVVFRWTEATGMVDLGDMSLDRTNGNALAVTPDGSVIAGYGRSFWGEDAFIWTSTVGMFRIEDFPGGLWESWIFDLNREGTLGLGYGSTDVGRTGALWDARHGLRPLREVLSDDYGADMSGWHFYLARGISDDDRTIGARAHTPWGTDEAVVVRLPAFCDDGIDNDGDGAIDHPADPACLNASSSERSGCQDGVDNDRDGSFDFDGGASWNGGEPIGPPDPACTTAWRDSETSGARCGLGAELLFAAVLLLHLDRRVRGRVGTR